MSKRNYDPSNSLTQFMYGIYDYHTDRGMNNKAAKAKMIDSTLEQTVLLMSKEKDIPDEVLVLMAQWMSRSLNNRGATMTEYIRELESKNNKVNTEPYIEPLRDIKKTKDVIDNFIETYKGWSELDV